MNQPLSEPMQRLVEARHHDPFELLGRHPDGKGGVLVRVYMPYAEQVRILERGTQQVLNMQRIDGSDFFEWQGQLEQVADDYRLMWKDKWGYEHLNRDPYAQLPMVSDFDLYLFNQGNHTQIQNFLGSHVMQDAHGAGVRFSVWAPNAERVSVVGDFNHWDGRCHPMRVLPNSGVWELFIPDLEPGGYYKFEVRDRLGVIHLKTDPMARQNQLRPETASVITPPSSFEWTDAAWLERRKDWDWQSAPISIYEMHPGSWQRGCEGEFLNYREMAHQLVPYLQELGFTHVELMPITEHPFDLSWGYQATGYFAPTRRFGRPDDFRYFVDYLHSHHIGVLLDWVPAHFPKDAHGLARFDGTPLYEHADPRLGEHLDWNTYIFNFGRNEVKSFLISSAMFWLNEFHLDGLRVDAVASMLYLDYSREEWIPNIYGGRENIEAVEFMRHLNSLVGRECPGALMIAEESTSWPSVTRPPENGGLGFHMKWNMGWMNDSLSYIAEDPIHRKYHHDKLTFSLYYAFSENFLLPFSHDEVVHGKGSMIGKMPGDEWQRFANLRALYLYQFTHPGKKLLFMGTEFGQGNEWNSTTVMEWSLLQYPLHSGMKQLVADLNHLYARLPALHKVDFSWQGFQWLDANDGEQSIAAYLRLDGETHVVVVINFTPVVRRNYRLGVPALSGYREVLNSDSSYYAGSNVGNGQALIMAEEKPWHEQSYSIELTLPPLGGVVLMPDQAE
ncbi:glycogen branching enzyme [Magnetococcus marinus MC-1]|uniref:1,4-alpha-glucan branching enzyme GlgB n=1 Tax=Magnetococcus marinus (strain ATCC BAA-1437 / JCM 17883 / MC-1) TaxID=156889 RepID=A0L7T4_MAGMM|nr:1,4-alpha-glucan branching protein GlgB [Magnetococcus marinus]ABK44027.1 glycogen branching enzyme [Magnetococcus marinus MC-1]